MPPSRDPKMGPLGVPVCGACFQHKKTMQLGSFRRCSRWFLGTYQAHPPLRPWAPQGGRMGPHGPPKGGPWGGPHGPPLGGPIVSGGRMGGGDGGGPGKIFETPAQTPQQKIVEKGAIPGPSNRDPEMTYSGGNAGNRPTGLILGVAMESIGIWGSNQGNPWDSALFAGILGK